MTHSDFSLVPESIETKTQFWSHIYTQIESLIEGERNWVSNLANAASVIYNALLLFRPHFGDGERQVNWCGFYLHADLFPNRSIPMANGSSTHASRLLLGPFNGKPACQFIQLVPGRGVCADAFLKKTVQLVRDVHSHPGHIACDGDTNSEIVLPLITPGGRAVGVLDLDCLALGGFDEDDKNGLEKIAAFLAGTCDW